MEMKISSTRSIPGHHKFPYNRRMFDTNFENTIGFAYGERVNIYRKAWAKN
jgi:hypothetical protein